MQDKNLEKINKERRYILVGVFTGFSLIKGFVPIGNKKSKVKNKSSSGFILLHFIWKIISFVRMLLKG